MWQRRNYLCLARRSFIRRQSLRRGATGGAGRVGSGSPWLLFPRRSLFGRLTQTGVLNYVARQSRVITMRTENRSSFGDCAVTHRVLTWRHTQLVCSRAKLAKLRITLCFRACGTLCSHRRRAVESTLRAKIRCRYLFVDTCNASTQVNTRTTQ